MDFRNLNAGRDFVAHRGGNFKGTSTVTSERQTGDVNANVNVNDITWTDDSKVFEEIPMLHAV